MSEYLIYSDHNDLIKSPAQTCLSPESAVLLDTIGYENWVNPAFPHTVSLASMGLVESAFCQEYLAKVIPYGPIEFVEMVLRRGHGIPKIIPQNIPEPLRTEEFCGREIIPSCTVADIPELTAQWGTNTIFVKSADKIKSDVVGFVRKNTVENYSGLEGDHLFVSEAVKFSSEWRVFVFRGRIIDVRPYAGDRWTMPDKAIVEKMVVAMGDSLHSYTLDVGVTNTGRTVVIEIHNFLSCGLYGATPPLAMYKAAYKQELEFHGKALAED